MLYIVTATTTSQWFILSQQLLRHSDLHITTTLTSLCSILLQQLLHHYDLYCYSNHYVPMINIVTAHYVTKTSYSSNYYVFMRYIVTATTTLTSLGSLLLQQLLRPYTLYCYNNYYVPMIYMVTAHITSLKPLYYSNSYAHMISTVTATITSPWSILLQHALPQYDPYRYSLLRHYDPYIRRTSTMHQ